MKIFIKEYGAQGDKFGKNLCRSENTQAHENEKSSMI
jgi:hypothetical protein